jgi:hypothetical protein
MSDPYPWNPTTPPTPVHLQDWRWYNMFVKACRERSWAAGFGEFPPCVGSWFDGQSTDGDPSTYVPSLITAISATGVSWDVGTLDANVAAKINGTPTDPPGAVLPAAWDVICWADNYDAPYRILRGRCTAVSGHSFTVAWSDNWRLRWGPEGLGQFLGKKLVVIPSDRIRWPYWHERVAERPSDFARFVGDALSRGPFAVSVVSAEASGLWFTAAGHTFRAGDMAVIAGGPLDGQAREVAGAVGDRLRLESPGSWGEPYPTGWTLRHAATVWPLRVKFGSTSGLPAACDLVVGAQRWRITAFSDDFQRLTCRLESGEEELPTETTGLGHVLDAGHYFSEHGTTSTQGVTTEERTSEYQVLGGEALSRGPWEVAAVELEGSLLWFRADGHTFAVGDAVVIAGGPLDGTTQTVAATRVTSETVGGVTIEHQWIRVGSPGTWEAPYAIGWTVRHAADVWPFARLSGSASEDLAGLWLVVGSDRWEITANSPDHSRLTLELREGESELPLDVAQYAAVVVVYEYTVVTDYPPFMPSAARNNSHDAFRWYTGVHTLAPTVRGNSPSYRGIADTHFVPKQMIRIDLGEGPIEYPLFDVDLWTPWTIDIPSPELSQNPDVSKSIRYLQQWIAGAANAFVKALPDSGTYHDRRNLITLGTRIFVDAGISGSREVLDVSYTYNPYHDCYNEQVTAECAAPEWYQPWMGGLMYLVVCTTRGDLALQSGTADMGEDGKFHFAFEAPIHFVQGGRVVWFPNSIAPTESFAVFLTPGFKRQVPAGIRYFYAKTCVLPSTTETGTPVIEDHGQKCGGFWTRDKSTTYEDGSPFEEGHRARYLGDGKHDPPTMMALAEGSSDMAYRAKYFTGRPKGWRSPMLFAGAITALDGHYLEDDTQNWHIEGDRYLPSAHSATAAGGAATSFTAAGKLAEYDEDGNRIAGSAFWSEPDMFGQPRFVGMTAEITLDGVVYPRRITGQNLGTQAISWAEPLPRAVAAGDTLVIREPLYELDRWQERRVTITLPACDVPKAGGGSVHFDAYSVTATILHNDATRLFPQLAEPLPVRQTVDGQSYTRSLAGCTYVITEYLPGEVWERSGGQWVRPVSSLPLEHLAPTTLHRHGWASLWDYVGRIGDGSVWAQMRAMLNLMTWTWVEGGISEYTSAAHDERTVVEDPQQSILAPPAMRTIFDGNAQAAADEELLESMWTTHPYAGPVHTATAARLKERLGFSQGWGYVGTDPEGVDYYGVYQVTRTQEYEWAGGYPHLTMQGDIRKLDASVDVYVLNEQMDPFLATEANPNTSVMVDVLAVGEKDWALVGTLGYGWHRHLETLILPPNDQWPTDINVSLMPTALIHDPDPIPEGFPFSPYAQNSWQAARVVGVCKWTMQYRKPDEP